MNNDGISNEGNRAVDSAVNGAENDPKRPVFLPGAEGPEAKSVKVEPMNTDNNRSSIKESSGSSADQPFKSAGASTTTYTAPTPSEASYKGGSSAALHCGGGTQTSGSEAVGTSAESTNAPATQAVLKQNVPSSQPDTKPRPRGSSDATIEEKKSADPSQNASVSVQEQQPLPNKLLTMAHLQRKYSGELEYMLREFRKLERQLLGAKGATQIEESAGSRERREKLHSFILHLEDTIRQIELGCKLEVEGKTTVNVGVATPDGESKTSDTIKTGLSQEKEEEENVQKLEEHILANLLPVKIRLKKQLAAQQGATRNPAGMPAPRRGYPQPADPDKGKGTFAAAAEQRRKQAEEMAAQQHQISPAEPVDPEQTHFGKPLGRRGSSLTQKLHGQTLGSKARLHGHGVGLAKPAPENDEGKSKIVYCGVAPGSKQVVSGVSAAASTHKMVIETPQLKSQVDSLENSGAPKVVHSSETAQGTGDQSKSEGKMSKKGPTPERAPTFKNHGTKRKFDDPTLTEDARETLRRKLQKKKQIVKAKRRELERQRQAAIQSTQSHGPSQIAGGRKKIVGKGNGKKRGPRSVEYICALCSETYNSVSDYNPWWALAQHSCPKCGKTQVRSMVRQLFESYVLSYVYSQRFNSASLFRSLVLTSARLQMRLNTIRHCSPMQMIMEVVAATMQPALL